MRVATSDADPSKSSIYRSAENKLPPNEEDKEAPTAKAKASPEKLTSVDTLLNQLAK